MELEDEISLLSGRRELVVSPGLNCVVEGGVGRVGVEREVWGGAIVGDEDGVRGADLRGANLIGSNLSGANLSDADLSGAHLNGANLRGAHLNGELKAKKMRVFNGLY